MSSLRNAVQRRNHKERAQPQERSKWGLLEKHKDYSLRAKDHNAKKRKLKALQHKASEKNEDEFYFGMMRDKTRRGVKVAERGEANSGGMSGAGRSLGEDVVKLMKTQDCAYLRVMLQSTRRQRDRVEKEVVAGEVGVPLRTAATSASVMLAEEGLATSATTSEPANGDQEDGESDGEEDKSPSPAEQSEQPMSKDQVSARRRKRHALEVKRKRLEALRSKEKNLTVALRQVEDQRARINGSAGGVNMKGTSFKPGSRGIDADLMFNHAGSVILIAKSFLSSQATAHRARTRMGIFKIMTKGTNPLKSAP